MFILRQIHIESRVVTNIILGDTYYVSSDGKQFFPDMLVNKPVLVGQSDPIQLSKDFDYYIMTDSGRTFEKLNIPESNQALEGIEVDSLTNDEPLILNSETNLLDQVTSMAEQSLSPDMFEKWEDVKNHLNNTRQALKVKPSKAVFRVEEEMLEIIQYACRHAFETDKPSQEVKDSLLEMIRRVDHYYGEDVKTN